jgi:hypothetical protein
MLRQAKSFTRIDRDYLVYAVAKNETPVQHRNTGFLDRHEITVQINHDEPCS